MNISRLAKLSGMAFAQFKYTAEEWLAKVGVDPREFPGLITTNRSGLCAWMPSAEQAYAQSTAEKRYWLAMLTGRIEW